MKRLYKKVNLIPTIFSTSKMNDNQKQPTFYYHSNHFLREIGSYTHSRQNNQNDLPILFFIFVQGSMSWHNRACNLHQQLRVLAHLLLLCQHPKHLKKVPISNNWRKKTCNGFFVKSTYGCDIIALSLVCKNFCRLLT